MTVKVITRPEPIVSMEEARKHLIDIPSEDDVYVSSLIVAATAWLDGPTGWLGRALGIQTLEYSGWFACRHIELPFPPVVGSVSIITEDDDGVQSTVDPATYRLVDGVVVIKAGAPWVTRYLHRIRYQAGYEIDDPDLMPIKVAILMMVAQWYLKREPVVIGAAVEEIPFSVNALLTPYRIYR